MDAAARQRREEPVRTGPVPHGVVAAELQPARPRAPHEGDVRDTQPRARRRRRLPRRLLPLRLDPPASLPRCGRRGAPHAVLCAVL